MKTYNSQEEVEKDVVDWVLKIKDDITFTFDLKMYIDIVAYNINAKNIHVNNIDCYDIKAYNININDIKAFKIKSYNIKANYIIINNIRAYNIDAYIIKSENIDANNIDVYTIDTNNIDAHNISYYAICVAYETFKCNSIKWRRKNSKHFCLDWEIEIIKK